MGFLQNTRKRISIKLKDQQINKNINHFIKNYQQTTIPTRETFFSPEILIPCYNHGKYLGDALKSISERIPVTIINDASDDDTPNYIKQFAEKYSFKLITNKEHLYQTGSLNQAIRESENNFFIVLNADDVLLNYWPSLMLNCFNKYPTIRLAGGNSLSFTNENILRMNEFMPDVINYTPVPNIIHPDNAKSYTHLNSINMTMSGCTFLRSCWESINGFWDFEKRVCSFDDRDFQMRASALFDIAILDEPSAFYRITSSQLMGQH